MQKDIISTMPAVLQASFIDTTRTNYRTSQSVRRRKLWRQAGAATVIYGQFACVRKFASHGLLHDGLSEEDIDRRRSTCRGKDRKRAVDPRIVGTNAIRTA